MICINMITYLETVLAADFGALWTQQGILERIHADEAFESGKLM